MGTNGEDSFAEISNRVFEFWKVRFGHPRARLDAKRRTRIRQRLTDGYTEQDLLDACEGCALSDYHMARHRDNMETVYDDLELILRDSKHVDKFIKILEMERAKKVRALAQARAQKEEKEKIERERAERGIGPIVTRMFGRRK